MSGKDPIDPKPWSQLHDSTKCASTSRTTMENGRTKAWAIGSSRLPPNPEAAVPSHGVKDSADF